MSKEEICRTCRYSKDSSLNSQVSDTLVIHPDDYTTEFLNEIYKGKGWDVITKPRLRPRNLKDAIFDHKRIIMLGHGTPQGLLGHYGYMIDRSLAPILRQRDVVAIWCHADQFMNRHRMKGFYSGMFISEEAEATFNRIYDVDEETVNE